MIKELNNYRSLDFLCWAKYLLLVLGLGFFYPLQGQTWELDLIKGAKKIQIPFEKINNFIVLNVRLNNQLPLKFILDTGARYTVLTKKELIPSSSISYLRSFSIYGADRSQKFTAYLAPNIEVNVEGILARKLSILVMEED